MNVTLVPGGTNKTGVGNAPKAARFGFADVPSATPRGMVTRSSAGTFTTTEVWAEIAPDDAWMIMDMFDCGVKVDATLIVRVVDTGCEVIVEPIGLKVTVMPAGTPDAENRTMPEKPFDGVIWTSRSRASFKRSRCGWVPAVGR